MVESIRVSASGHRHDPVCEFRLSMKHGQAERHERFTCGRDKPLGEVFEASGDRQRALGLYELAVTSLERVGKPYLTEAARRLAGLLEAEGRQNEALEVLKRAVGGATPAPEPVRAQVD